MRSGGSLPSAAALLVCIPLDRKASAEGGFIFALPPFNSHGLGGWGERGVDVSLTSGTGFLVCMPANREGAREIFIRFAYLPFDFHELGTGEGKGVGDPYS